MITDQTQKTIAITGATGLLGNQLCSHFAARGWRVYAGVRHPAQYKSSDPSILPFLCDLPDHLEKSRLVGANVCIHAAYTTRHTTLETARRVNEIGTRTMLSACREAGVQRFVFISSTAAHARALSYYGRSKFALEKELNLQHDLIIRPGLILGNGGLFQRLCDSVRRSRLIPLFDGGRQIVQTISLDNLCQMIVLAVEKALTGRLVLAEPQGILMRDLLASIAQKMRKRPLFIHLPITPVLLLLRLFESLHIGLPVSSENLLGLKAMEHQESAKDLARLGVFVRPARESLDDIP